MLVWPRRAQQPWHADDEDGVAALGVICTRARVKSVMIPPVIGRNCTGSADALESEVERPGVAPNLVTRRTPGGSVGMPVKFVQGIVYPGVPLGDTWSRSRRRVDVSASVFGGMRVQPQTPRGCR